MVDKETENKRVTFDLDQKKLENENLNHANQNLTFALKEKEIENEKLNQILGQLRENEISKQNTITELTRKLLEKENKQNEFLIHGEKASTEIERLKTQLTHSMQINQENENTIESLHQYINQLQIEKQYYQEIQHNKEYGVLNAQEMDQKWQSINQDYQHQINQQIMVNNSLNQQVQEQGRLIEDLNELYKNVYVEINSITNDVKQENTENFASQDEWASIIDKLKRYKTDNLNLFSEIKEKEKSLNVMKTLRVKSDHIVQEEQLIRQTEEINQKIDEIDRLQETKLRNQQRITELQTQYELCEEKLRKKLKIKSECTDQQKLINKQKTEIEQKMTEIDRLRILDDKYESCKEKLRNIIVSMKIQDVNLDLEMEYLIETLENHIKTKFANYEQFSNLFDEIKNKEKSLAIMLNLLGDKK